MSNTPPVNGVEFAFYHSLVDDDPSHAAPALEALGRVAASWSRMEHHLDALIIQINKPVHSESLYAEHPVSFSKKIDVLKSWFNRYPPLASYREDMRYLTSRLKFISKENGSKVVLNRNILLHSIPASFDGTRREIVLHHMMFLPDGNIRSRHITITLEQLAAYAGIVQMCNQYLSYITRELFTREGYEKIQKRE
ncbi:hypothetical protein [Mesorhizobium sp. M0228]|uniref:hypothetical protein n=1 Tax=Mesorhizobium sp. M0228 TaxID=2956923 RepID=UPI0033356B15